MKCIDLIVELIYAPYEKQYRKERLKGEEKFNEGYKNFSETLNREQGKFFLNFYDMSFELQIRARKHAIKYMLLLLCPEELWNDYYTLEN